MSRRTNRPARSAQRGRRPLSLESLEPRNLLYNLSGQSWDHSDISYSLVPDGTQWHTGPSVLFSKQNQAAPPEIWQREVARAFQAWANHADINFQRLEDDGLPFGQMDPNDFQADIRIGSSSSDYATAYAFAPWEGAGGDITLNAAYESWRLNGEYGTRRVLAHEIGHALGLEHEFDHESVMGWQSREYPGLLTSDDIAGMQAIYGARLPDIYDAAAANNQISTATHLPVGESGSLTISADLTSHADVDYFQITMPADRSYLTVSVDAQQISLLAPAVAIYDSQGTLLAESKSDYGEVSTVSLFDALPRETYFVAADGATSDEFGMGAYQLEVQFSGSVPVTQPTNIDVPLAQSRAVDVGIQADVTNDHDAAMNAELLPSTDVATSQTGQPTTSTDVDDPCGCPACCADVEVVEHTTTSQPEVSRQPEGIGSSTVPGHADPSPPTLAEAYRPSGNQAVNSAKSMDAAQDQAVVTRETDFTTSARVSRRGTLASAQRHSGAGGVLPAAQNSPAGNPVVEARPTSANIAPAMSAPLPGAVLANTRQAAPESQPAVAAAKLVPQPAPIQPQSLPRLTVNSGPMEPPGPAPGPAGVALPSADPLKLGAASETGRTMMRRAVMSPVTKSMVLMGTSLNGNGSQLDQSAAAVATAQPPLEAEAFVLPTVRADARMVDGDLDCDRSSACLPGPTEDDPLATVNLGGKTLFFTHLERFSRWYRRWRGN